MDGYSRVEPLSPFGIARSDEAGDGMGKIAVVHAFLLALGGAERTTSAIAEAFPQADCFAILCDRQTLPEGMRNKDVRTSGLNWLPRKYHLYRHLLPLWPNVVELIDLRGYEVVISSDSSVVKGVNVDQDAVHICYCHNPMRCLWDLRTEYYAEMPRVIQPIFALGTHYVRQWDYIAAQHVDHFVANSHYVARRIKKYYNREATVIYPPVETAKGYIASNCSGDYYLSVGRLTATKRIDLLVSACNRLGRRLKIAGAGREEARLKAMAGPTIEFLGYLPDAELRELYANCKAFIFAADEDFGLVPLEAQSYGRPVIAYGHGGSLETVRVGDPGGRADTGVFFRHQDTDSVVDAILQFEACEDHFDPVEIRARACQFDTAVFNKALRAFVRSAASAGKQELRF
jgi:glycosyltransferase involved in cell wall biosynthesis